MHSHEHAVLGGVAAAALLATVVPPLPPAATVALWAGGVVLSVLVDLDHFPVARLVAGDWRHARRVLANPRDLVGDQAWVFEDMEGKLRGPRLASHAVAGAVLVGSGWLAWPPLAPFVAGVLAVHVAADLLRDAGLA